MRPRHDTHAAASSDKTKKYGNGKTAGQIAIQNGAAPTAILHGPGNSQPHKVAPCTGGDEVDVHALKSKGHRKACGTPSERPQAGTGTGLQHERELGPEPQHERSPRWLRQRRGSGVLAAHRRSEPEPLPR